MPSSYITTPYLSLRSCIMIFVLLSFSGILAIVATPKYKTLSKPPILEEVIPLKAGEWENRPSPYAQVSVNTYAQNLSDYIYDQVLMRTYEDKSGNQIMLAVAFAGKQRQEVKIHQPEVCYPAQGYQTVSVKSHAFNISSYPVPINGKQLVFQKESRLEAVSYWIRLGDSNPTTGMQMRWKILKEGLKGNLDDGVLVRVSTIINQSSDATAAYALHDKFLNELVSAVGTKTPNLLIP